MSKLKGLLLFFVLCIGMILIRSTYAETCTIADGIYMETDENYSCIPLSDGMFLISDLKSGTSAILTAIDIRSLGLPSELVKELFMNGDEVTKFGNGITIKTGPHISGEVVWYDVDMTVEEQNLNGIMGVIGSYEVTGAYFEGTVDSLDGILSQFHVSDDTSTESKTNTGLPAATELYGKDITDVVGFYDADFHGLDTGINLLLSPLGHGKIINSSGSVSFEYSFADGVFTLEEEASEVLTLVKNGEKSILVKILVAEDEYMELNFIKRDDSKDTDGIVGEWKAYQIKDGSVTYDQHDMEKEGLSVDMIVYSNGVIDWHAVTDSEDEVAQGWGIDENGYYFTNGDVTYRIVINKDELSLFMNDSGKIIIINFTRIK